ncbi:MAG: hypothetical protein IJV99_00495 [Clostridia bacterium]|nr:hypothetical protein [Clostridia bacterium]
MNEKLQYATMLEIPVNTATVTYKPIKKKRKRPFGFGKKANPEQVKNQLIEKVNSESVENPTEQDLLSKEEQVSVSPEQEYAEQVGVLEEQTDIEQALEEPTQTQEQTATVKPKPKRSEKPRLKISVIGVQFIIIGALMATIFLTSALNANSGINVFLRGVFGVEQSASVDNRTHLDFTPVINVDGMATKVENGVMTFSGEGSIYPPCNGEVVSSEIDENGRYSLTIKHSEKFSSVITGLDYVYAELGGAVRGNIPVGYSKEDATMCFTGLDGSIIAGYEIIDNSVVWAV